MGYPQSSAVMRSGKSSAQSTWPSHAIGSTRNVRSDFVTELLRQGGRARTCVRSLGAVRVGRTRRRRSRARSARTVLRRRGAGMRRGLRPSRSTGAGPAVDHVGCRGRTPRRSLPGRGRTGRTGPRTLLRGSARPVHTRPRRRSLPEEQRSHPRRARQESARSSSHRLAGPTFRSSHRRGIPKPASSSPRTSRRRSASMRAELHLVNAARAQTLHSTCTSAVPPPNQPGPKRPISARCASVSTFCTSVGRPPTPRSNGYGGLSVGFAARPATARRARSPPRRRTDPGLPDLDPNRGRRRSPQSARSSSGAGFGSRARSPPLRLPAPPATAPSRTRCGATASVSGPSCSTARPRLRSRRSSDRRALSRDRGQLVVAAGKPAPPRPRRPASSTSRIVSTRAPIGGRRPTRCAVDGRQPVGPGEQPRGAGRGLSTSAPWRSLAVTARSLTTTPVASPVAASREVECQLK